jgi:hypothetical protein
MWGSLNNFVFPGNWVDEAEEEEDGVEDADGLDPGGAAEEAAAVGRGEDEATHLPYSFGTYDVIMCKVWAPRSQWANWQT